MFGMTTSPRSSGPVFEDKTFDILILDEASQVPEPMALVPLSKFTPSEVMLVGDPKQLSGVVRTSDLRVSNNNDLSRTMFERLAA
ncbi:hypothetical protein T484DRAFT_1869593, partial [Baffinella frigidus]